jgi:hypothetical protein
MVRSNEGRQLGSTKEAGRHGETASTSSTVSQTSPASRFTAVNGREALSVNTAVNDHFAAPRSQPNADLPPPSAISRTEPAERDQRDTWGQRSSNGDRNPPRPLSQSQEMSQSSPQSTLQKRKRSESDEEREAQAQRDQNSQRSPEKNAVPPSSSSLTAQHLHTTLHPLPSPMSASTQSTATPDQPRSHPSSTNFAYRFQPPPSKGPEGLERGIDQSDAQLAEALQRESRNMDANQAQRAESLEEEGSHSPSQRPADYGKEQTPTGSQVDHKRRKRIFSNRTKTGCLTCRRRKKKCDETKPECKF